MQARDPLEYQSVGRLFDEFRKRVDIDPDADNDNLGTQTENPNAPDNQAADPSADHCPDIWATAPLAPFLLNVLVFL